MKYWKVGLLAGLLWSSLSVASAPQLPQSESELSSLAQNIEQPVEVRAEAVVRLGQFNGPNAIIGIGRASRDDNPQLRLAAIYAVEAWGDKAKWDVVSPLLIDTNPQVKAEAGRVLAMLWQQLNAEQQKPLQGAIDTYFAELDKLDDQHQATFAKATVYHYQGDLAKAETLYKQLVKQSPRVELYSRLSDIARQQGDNVKALEQLEAGVKAYPDNAPLVFNLGLAYQRAGDQTDALKHIERSRELDKGNNYYAYVEALLVFETEPKKGASLMQQAYEQSQRPQYLFALCDMQLKLGDSKAASSCIEQLTPVAPKSVVEELQQRLSLL